MKLTDLLVNLDSENLSRFTFQDEIPLIEVFYRLTKTMDDIDIAHAIIISCLRDGVWKSSDSNLILSFNRKTEEFFICGSIERYPQMFEKISAEERAENTMNRLQRYRFCNGQYLSQYQIEAVTDIYKKRNKTALEAAVSLLVKEVLYFQKQEVEN